MRQHMPTYACTYKCNLYNYIHLYNSYNSNKCLNLDYVNEMVIQRITHLFLHLKEERICSLHLELIHGSQDVQWGIKSIMGI